MLAQPMQVIEGDRTTIEMFANLAGKFSPLFVALRHNGVHANRAPRRNVARQKSNA